VTTNAHASSRVMLDTQILIYSTRDPKTPKAKDWSKDAHDKIRRSKEIVQSLEVLRVSAIVVLEFLRSLPPAEQVLVDQLVKKMQIEACDGAVALLASDLLKHRVHTQKACVECLNLLASALMQKMQSKRGQRSTSQ